MRNGRLLKVPPPAPHHRERAGLALDGRRGLVEEPLGLLPAHARVGHRHTILERGPRHELLAAGPEVALEQQPHDRVLAPADLRQHLADHARLSGVVLTRVPVRAVDQQARWQSSAAQPRRRGRDLLSAVIGAAVGSVLLSAFFTFSFFSPTGMGKALASSRWVWLSTVRAPITAQLSRSER